MKRVSSIATSSRRTYISNGAVGIPDFIKLVDFGVARVLDGMGPTTTQSGRVFGTAAYISPEAATGRRDSDRRSDIYSLGVLSYLLLDGRVALRRNLCGESCS